LVSALKRFFSGWAAWSASDVGLLSCVDASGVAPTAPWSVGPSKGSFSGDFAEERKEDLNHASGVSQTI